MAAPGVVRTFVVKIQSTWLVTAIRRGLSRLPPTARSRTLIRFKVALLFNTFRLDMQYGLHAKVV